MSTSQDPILNIDSNKTSNYDKQPIIIYQTNEHGRYIYSIFHLIMSLVAIYLSFKCNNGFNFGSFIFAICVPYIYIIYILATNGTCGLLENVKKK